MKTVCIIQQRLGSTRLPGKAIMDIAGKTLTERVVERVRLAKTIKQIEVAIPEEPNYMALCRVLKEMDIKPIVVAGESWDLLNRYVIAANVTDADIVVRIPGDNPCVDPDEIDRMVNYYNEDPGRWDWLTTNLDRDVLGNGYPGGLGCEVYDTRFLRWMDKHLTEKRHREHPHLWAFEQGHVRTILAPEDIRRPWLDFSVNTQKDLDYVNDLYWHWTFSSRPYSIREVMQYLDHKERLNESVGQSEQYG